MAGSLAASVSSLQSSLQLLDSSIAILDEGVSDFPRMAKVLQTRRVRSSHSFLPLIHIYASESVADCHVL